MSHDLSFWRYRDEALPRSDAEHHATYTALSEGGSPADVAPLPHEAVLAALEAALAHWRRSEIGWERDDASIELTLTDRFARFDLRGAWTGDDANLLIDVLNPFGCPLYDQRRYAL